MPSRKTVRTTVDIPTELHDLLSDKAQAFGTSIRALVIRAIEDAYQPPRKGRMVTGPFIKAGKLGPDFPTDENPHDLVFS